MKKVINGYGVYLQRLFLKELPDFLFDVEISSEFDCSNNNLTSLKGCPRVVNGGFYCDSNPDLTSLEGCPEIVGEDFICWATGIDSLKYAPKHIYGSFHCNRNINLINLTNGPTTVGGGYYAQMGSLKSLEGAPVAITGNMDCSFNKLTSLKWAPTTIHNGYFNCEGNKLLKSLKHATVPIKSSFHCGGCDLSNLVGAPERVKGSFTCENNPLLSLDGIPKIIDGDFVISTKFREKFPPKYIQSLCYIGGGITYQNDSAFL